MRYDWLDTAKGWAIVMVVFAHSLSWLGLGEWPFPFLETVRDIMSTARAPVFFCVSGIFAGRAIAGSWRDLYRSRIAPFLWVFLLWQVVVFAYKLVGDLVLGGGTSMSLVSHLGRAALFLVRPNGELWYLWALILFLIAAKLLRGVRPSAVIGASIALSIGWTAAELVMPATIIDLLGVGWNGLFTFAVFFFAGVLHRDRIIAAAIGAGRIGAVLTVIVWLSLVAVALVLDAKHSPLFEPATYTLGLAAALSVCAAFFTKPSLMSRIGSRWTLPVFLTHTALLVVAGSILRVSGYVFDPGSVLSNALVFAIVALVVTIGCWIGASAASSRGRWLFAAPRWFFFERTTSRA